MGRIADLLTAAGVHIHRANSIDEFGKLDESGDEPIIITTRSDGSEVKRSVDEIAAKYTHHLSGLEKDPVKRALAAENQKLQQEKTAALDAEIAALEAKKKQLNNPDPDHIPAWKKKHDIYKKRVAMKKEVSEEKKQQREIFNAEVDSILNKKPEEPRLL